MKLIKITILIFLIFIFLIFSFFSCFFPSNLITFDLKKQLVKSCNCAGIYYLEIEDEDMYDEYWIKFMNSENSPPTCLSLFSIPKDYDIYKGTMKVNRIKLRPCTRYRITRSQGDASGATIHVITDEHGKVAICESDEINCNLK